MLQHLLHVLRSSRKESLQTAQTTAADGAIVAADAFPGPFLPGGPLAPEIRSEADLERGCRQIGWLKAREDTVSAVHDQCLAELTETRNRELQLTVDGALTMVPTYRVALTEAVRDFSRNHPEILPAGRKSRAFPGAVVKTAAKPLSIVPISGDREATLTAIERALDLPRRLQELAQQHHGLAALLPLVRIEVKLDLQGALVRYKAREISLEQLAAAGLRAVEDEAIWTVTPAQLP